MPDKRLLHTARIPVRWSDMGNYGHVRNILYFQYLEEARVAWFMAASLDADEAPVVLQSLHTYLKSVVFPSTVVIELYAGHVGTSSLVLEHRLSTQEDPRTTYGEGHCKLVWVHRAENRSMPLPQSIRAVLG